MNLFPCVVWTEGAWARLGGTATEDVPRAKLRLFEEEAAAAEVYGKLAPRVSGFLRLDLIGADVSCLLPKAADVAAAIDAAVVSAFLAPADAPPSA